MTDPQQIPHLVKLLDDESSDVRLAVTKELAAFGPTLLSELKKTDIPLNAIQKGYIGKILEGHKRIWLKMIWSKWLRLPAHKYDLAPEYKRMEIALSVLSEFISGMDYNMKLGQLLDELAVAYKVKYHEHDPKTLAKFLFKEKGLRGEENDYYNVQNNNLIYVIKKKRGVPISLAAVYALVGLRLGMIIEGCHFPGHFLARFQRGSKVIFVDCFNGGQMIDEKDLLSIKEDTFRGMKKVLRERTDIEMIVRAFLVNIIRSYQIQEDRANCEVLMGLFDEMDLRANSKIVSELTPNDIINSNKPRFQPGHCVRHQRYDYRGIVVDVDSECEATDDWYYGNQTQPSRHQPWYHVLVHGSDQVTYVAENHLIEDRSRAKLTHPLLSYFFSKTEEGGYIRNDNIWPETDF